MGDFYETFEEDAKIAARVLGIALTKRANGAAADVPLAGFPHHALDTYLHKLVRAGYKVAICEQLEDPKLAKGIVKRDVVEVITQVLPLPISFLTIVQIISFAQFILKMRKLGSLSQMFQPGNFMQVRSR
jgi:hypothetical protein